MIKIKAIDHIVLRTNKKEAMLHFYCDVLGCDVERSLEESSLTQLRAGHAMIDLINVDNELGRMEGSVASNSDNNMDHFCLQIHPIEEETLRQFLESKDIEVGEFQERYGAQGFGRSIYIKDPENNTVELRSFKEEHVL